MPVRRRNDKRRARLDDDEQAWLRGESHSGFVEFMPEEILRELWDRCGDHDLMQWTVTDSRPRERSKAICAHEDDLPNPAIQTQTCGLDFDRTTPPRRKALEMLGSDPSL